MKNEFYATAIRLSLAAIRGWDFTDSVEEVFQLDTLDAEERLDTLTALRGCVPAFCVDELEQLIEEAQDELPDDEPDDYEGHLELIEEDRRHGFLD